MCAVYCVPICAVLNYSVQSCELNMLYCTWKLQSYWPSVLVESFLNCCTSWFCSIVWLFVVLHVELLYIGVDGQLAWVNMALHSSFYFHRKYHMYNTFNSASVLCWRLFLHHISPHVQNTRTHATYQSRSKQWLQKRGVLYSYTQILLFCTFFAIIFILHVSKFPFCAEPFYIFSLLILSFLALL